MATAIMPGTKEKDDMKTEHTPGPWQVAFETDIYAPGKDGKILVASADQSNFIPYDQKVANARLIAADPELLHARARWPCSITSRA